MASLSQSTQDSQALNVSLRLSQAAQLVPDQVAIAEPLKYDAQGKRQYATISFQDLEADVERLARGFQAIGVQSGVRLALMVTPGIDFITLVFALLRCGAVQILIDPGMGRKNLLKCLDEARPEGFVAIPLAHAVRTLLMGRYRDAKLNVTVGRRWFWGGKTISQLRKLGEQSTETLPTTTGDDPAAIIFTSGSTGPPKGVLYTQRIFDTQATEIRDRYGIEPGELDLPAFPLFGLFNAAMGVTTVLPDMDFTRPADVDPVKIIEAINDWKITQSFGSPAVWNRVGLYCQQTGTKMPTLRRVLSAGAPVPAHVLERITSCIHPEGSIHTPYGATESLPVATISATEVLSETREKTDAGAGVCVGNKFSSIAWKVIRITDDPIASINEIDELPQGEIGELIVSGPQVTSQYVTRTEWNAKSKIVDGSTHWHRMGDVGYFDPQGRFWFCGRKAHRVETTDGTLYTIPCEAIFNTHGAIYRTALVGVGPGGEQQPVLIAEPQPGQEPIDAQAKEKLIGELSELGQRHPGTKSIERFLLHPSLPVDIRHNAKIFRERLAEWAAAELAAQDN